MEEIDELRAKAIASMSATANPNLKLQNKPLRTREEGELSSSEDNEIPTCSAAQSSATMHDPVKPNSVTLGSKHAQTSNLGKSDSAIIPASSGDIQFHSSAKQNYRKRFQKNPVPSKSGSIHTPGRFVHPGISSNLVISFSDDDSGSDSEEYKSERPLERTGGTLGVDDYKRPPASSKPKPEMLRQAANNQMQMMPKKVSRSRTFISSINKIHGANSKSSVSSLVEQGSHFRNFDLLSRTSAIRERESSQCVDLNNSKLESLRQQIAIRENELKLQLKSVQQNKETVSSSYSEYTGTTLNNDTASKGKPTNADAVQLAPNGQDRKRRKLDEPYSSKLNSDGQLQIPRPATKSMAELKMPLLEYSDANDTNMVACGQCSKEISVSTTKPSIEKRKRQDDEQVPVSSEYLVTGVKDGESSVPFLQTLSSTVPNFELSNKRGHYSLACAGICASCGQSGERTKLADPFAVLNRSSQLAQITSRVDDEAACQLKLSSSKKLTTEELKHPTKFGVPHSSTSFPNKETSQNNLMRSNEYGEGISSDRTLDPSADNICNVCSVPVPDGKLGTSGASLNKASLLNCSGQLNISGHNSKAIQSVVKIEELLDKELEEAQEHRHRCEVEERNVLKAYHNAQRTLVEANARCTFLYQKRELYSARFRAFMMEDSTTLWSSRWPKNTEIGLDSLNAVPEVNVDLLPTLDHHMQAEFEVLKQLGYDSNIQWADGALLDASYRQMSGQNLGSNPCSEPDASTSELLQHKDNSAVNGVCSPSNNPNILADEAEDAFPFNNKAVQSTLVCESKEVNLEEMEMKFNEGSRRKISIDGSQEDCALLEASLRSELFARLGMKSLLKNNSVGFNTEHTVDKRTESDGKSKKDHMNMGNQTFPVAEQSKVSNLGVSGTDRPERSICELSVHIHDQCREKCSFNNASLITADPEDSGSSLREAYRSTASVSSLPSSVLRSAFGNVKVTSLISFIGFETGNQLKHTNKISNGEDTGISYHENLLGVLRADCTSIGKIGSYTCDLSVDPFWPLCMYELRGKCNNEECPLQHVKYYSLRNINQLGDSASADCQMESSSHLGKYTGAAKLSKFLDCHSMSAPPTYLVGSDLLKADLHSYESVLARGIGQCWQKGFSTSLGVPFSIQRKLPSEEPFLHGSDGHIEVHGSWNRQSLYFQSQDGAVKQFKQGLSDPEQSLDMALVILSRGVNKLEGKKKALPLLSRALETDPTSVVLWIVYLHIYYRNEKAIGVDDMFFHAIQHNEGSYELWLMYINSRVQLDHQLVAYDTALSALCRHASAPDRDPVHASACILDLFLQMMDCFCMSGTVGNAIQRIYGLFSAVKASKEPRFLLLSDIITCLTISDKCIFWVCCVYLVIYKKLPEAVVQQFEREKGLLFAIEWPSIQLTADGKQHSVELMEMAVDSVALCINSGLFERETALRSAHFLALSHVKCIAALEGLECSRNFLDEYIKLYPTCLELVLTSARLQKHDLGDMSYAGFEKALSNWPKEVPGIQCIWNQYAEFALENGSVDFAKELMVRWYQSVWKVQYPQNGKSDTVKHDGLYGSTESTSAVNPDECVASNQKDDLFGLLNLSLHRLLQKDQIEARQAIDRALKAAAPEDFKYCVREHAMFLLTGVSQLMEDAPANGIVDVLYSYLLDARSFPVSEPLSRKFIQNIKRPRTPQLINNMLGPISCDCALVNLVLEAWHGLYLLPEEFGKLKDLVDLVEAIMEILPANYHLALSVCKLIAKDSKSPSVVFWASSVLVNSIFQAVPVAPEHIWVEAAGILGNLIDIQAMSERFHRRGLSIYPFSIKLWKSYLNLSKMTGNTSALVEAAKERGIRLD
ncbi:hypothetical protein HHK36_018386 [Tetracentron sinense]|uniref:Putative zinc-finger domain-containing protein n=1 Tax=Tetracentron sinense TaxID=13715 RepID=A0A834Z3U0_TETSI|nr:hypothetical protein HHK36_018386 [Tetracentron sinense]